MSVNARVITGQLVMSGSVQQLPSSGPLTQGVAFTMYSPSDGTPATSVSTNPATTGAIDGTGDGLLLIPNLITVASVIPVTDTNAFYVSGNSGDVLSWAAW